MTKLTLTLDRFIYHRYSLFSSIELLPSLWNTYKGGYEICSDWRYSPKASPSIEPVGPFDCKLDTLTTHSTTNLHCLYRILKEFKQALLYTVRARMKLAWRLCCFFFYDPNEELATSLNFSLPDDS